MNVFRVIVESEHETVAVRRRGRKPAGYVEPVPGKVTTRREWQLDDADPADPSVQVEAARAVKRMAAEIAAGRKEVPQNTGKDNAE